MTKEELEKINKKQEKLLKNQAREIRYLRRVLQEIRITAYKAVRD